MLHLLIKNISLWGKRAHLHNFIIGKVVVTSNMEHAAHQILYIHVICCIPRVTIFVKFLGLFIHMFMLASTCFSALQHYVLLNYKCIMLLNVHINYSASHV